MMCLRENKLTRFWLFFFAKIAMTAVCLGWGFLGVLASVLIGATSGMIGGKLLAGVGFVGLIPVLSVGY